MDKGILSIHSHKCTIRKTSLAMQNQPSDNLFLSNANDMSPYLTTNASISYVMEKDLSYPSNVYSHRNLKTNFVSKQVDSQNFKKQFDPQNKSWLRRLSTSIYQLAQSSIPFLGGESDDKSSLDSLAQIGPRVSVCSRSTLWKGKHFSNNNAQLLATRIFYWGFWYKFFKHLWLAKGKRLFSVIFFLILCILSLLCFGSALKSLFKIYKNKQFSTNFPTEITDYSNSTNHLPYPKEVNSSSLDEHILKFIEIQDKKIFDISTSISETLSKFDMLTQYITTQSNHHQNKYQEFTKDLTSLDVKIDSLIIQINEIEEKFLLSNTTSTLSNVSKILYLENQSLDSLKNWIQDSIEPSIQDLIVKYNTENTPWADPNNSFISTLNATIYKLLRDTQLNFSNMDLKQFEEDIINKIIFDKRLERYYEQNLASLPPYTDIRSNELNELYIKARKLEDQLEEVMKIQLMDSTGEIDWASQSLGATIVHSETSHALNTDDWLESVLNLIAKNLPGDSIHDLIKPMGKPAEVVLQPDVNPGQCFAFSGQEGNITIYLPATVKITSVTLQHVTREINHNVKSTPKHFRVYGVSDPKWPDAFETFPGYTMNKNSNYCNPKFQDCSFKSGSAISSGVWNWIQNIWSHNSEIQHLGDFFFDPRQRIQSYKISATVPIRKVIFSFIENHGGSYTCVYRIRVHGQKMQRKAIY